MSDPSLYKETKSIYEEIKGEKFPYKPEDMENIKFVALRQTKFSEEFLAEAIYLADMGYRDYGNPAWSSYKPKNKDCEYNQNWKTHVAIDSIESYYQAMQVLIPELKRLNIEHKIISPDWYPGQQESKVQKGKCLAIYESDLTFVQDLNEKAKAFLLEEPEFTIPTDIQIGGRFCGRYTNSRYDLGINPKSGEMEKLSRENKNTFKFDPKHPEKTYYRPSFIPDPPSLDELLDMPREIKGEYQPHRENLKFYLARSGSNNELLKGMLSHTMKEFAEKNIEDPWFKKHIDYDLMANVNETNYQNQTILEVAMEHGNQEIVEFLGGTVEKENTLKTSTISVNKELSVFEKVRNLSTEEVDAYLSKRIPNEKEMLKVCNEKQIQLVVGAYIYEEMMPEKETKETINVFITDMTEKMKETKEELLKNLQLGLRKEKAMYETEKFKHSVLTDESKKRLNYADERIQLATNIRREIQQNHGMEK